MIKLNHHHVYPESIENVVEVLKSGWTGLGKKVQEFEDKVKDYLSTPFAIGFNSGTSALQAAMTFIRQAIPGNYVITTPNTFVSTNHCIVQGGFHPVFADIEPDTGNIDAKSVERLLSDPFIRARVKGIVVVHYGGLPVDQNAIYDIAQTYGIDVIEDASHAFGATYQGDKIGCKYSRLVAISCHAVKPLALGEGGILTTNDETVNSEARKLRWCGIDKSTVDRSDGSSYQWDYDVKYIGFKSHMSNIAAAIGCGQLLHIDEDLKYRQTLVDLYRQILTEVPQISLTRTFSDRTSANHLFVIRCESKEIKDQLMAFLADNGIQTGCHYRPTHMYRLYQRYDTDNGCQEAIKFFEQAISLPLHINLTQEDVIYVCEKVKDFFKGKRE